MRNDANGPSWIAVAAVVTVTVLTATSMAGFAASRHLRTAAVSLSTSSPAPKSSPGSIASPIPLAQADNVELSAPSADVVWALVDYGDLYLSIDGGGHWERHWLPVDPGVRPSISFVSASEGWMLAPGPPTMQCGEQAADIWHTTDAARSWQSVGGRIDKGQCKNGIWFADSTHGFVTASDPNHAPTVYRTSDGGAHWATSVVPDNPIFVTVSAGFTLHVNWIKAFGQTIYMQASGSQDSATWHDRDFIYTSRDGGATWTWKQKIASPFTFLVTESRWLQLAPDIALSVNGGQAFAPLATNLKVGTPVQASFPDGEVGFVSTGGAVLRTSDGGLDWTPLVTPWSAPAAGLPSPTPSPAPSPIPMPTWADLSAPSANVLWALIGNSRLFLSKDQGSTWNERTWPPHTGGGGNPVIAFADANNGWALLPGVPSTQCLEAGAQLWATSDGALTWHQVAVATQPPAPQQSLTFEQCKDFVYFADAHAGFVAGHDTSRAPIISRTADGGKTWSQSTLPNPPGYAVDGAVNALQVVAMQAVHGELLLDAESPIGAQFVFSSSSGGATWSFVGRLPPNAYEVVTFVTATRWLTIGNDGNGQETTDAGKTWHAFSCDYNDAAGVASAFVFADASVGYGTVRGGIQVTADGGAHWTRIKTPGT